MFTEIRGSIDYLCAALQCSPDELYEAVANQRKYCNQLAVPRRRASKKPRLVWSVSDPLRRLQRQIALWLRHRARGQDVHVTGFREESSPFMNAVRHVGKEVVLTADLSDFFGTISLSDVMVLFENLGAERPASTVLARLCTIDERLMQGGRASAAIANLVAQRLDSIILREIDSEAVYTRYVDDITISGPAVAIPSIQRLTAWIESAGFMLRPGSAIRKARSAGPFVTGLNVGGDWPRVPRKLRRRIERYLRFAADPRFDEESAAARTFKRGRLTDPSTARAYIRGMANWVRSIDEELARRWDLKLDALSEEDSQH